MMEIVQKVNFRKDELGYFVKGPSYDVRFGFDLGHGQYAVDPMMINFPNA